MYVEQYVSGSCQTLNSPLCKRHEPNASNSRAGRGHKYGLMQSTDFVSPFPIRTMKILVSPEPNPPPLINNDLPLKYCKKKSGNVIIGKYAWPYVALS